MKLKYCLLLLLWPVVNCFAQSPPSIHPLTVGDTVPDIVLTNVYNFPVSKIQLSSFNDKLIILDFWATWCGSCISAMPRMQQLQDSFKKDLQVIMVNANPNDDRAKIESFAAKRKLRTGHSFSMPTLLQDTLFKQIFPHQFIPHYVWLGKNRRVLAITAEEELNAENILRVLSGQTLSLPLKDDSRSYNELKTLQSETQGSMSADIVYRSVLTGYRAELGSASGTTANAEGLITKYYAVNTSLYSLFQMAWPRIFRFSSSRTVVDGERFDLTKKYCYELTVPGLSESETLSAIQNDLMNAFRIKVKNEKRLLHCFVLKRFKTVSPPLTCGAAPATDIERTSLRKYMQNTSAAMLASWLHSLLKKPVLDETGLTKHIDLDIPFAVYDFNEKQLQAWLAEAGFQLVPANRLLEVAVITGL